MSNATATLRDDLQQITDKVPDGSKVLEIGCGDGDLLYHLQHEKRCDARGIELEQARVSACVERGLAVSQGDADEELTYYPDQSFDVVILAKTMQATKNPKEVINEALRIGTSVIVSFPNFGHWRNRLYLGLKGRMPVTSYLSYEWYETPNIHFCTVRDFRVMAEELHAEVKDRTLMNDRGKPVHITECLGNLIADQALFILARH